MRRKMWWTDEDCRADFLGFGSTHDLRDADSEQHNPRLIGLISVSYAAAVALNKRQEPPKSRKIGFDTTSHLKRKRR